MSENATKDDIKNLGKSIDLLREQMNDLKKGTQVIQKILTGNGEPNKGLVFRMSKAEDRILIMLKVLSAIGMTVIGVLALELIRSIGQ